MNYSFNIFGRNGKNELFYKADENKLLLQIAKESLAESQMTVYRKSRSIYYVYIRKLTGSNDFIGISLVFNGVYCIDNKKLFDLFEETVKNEIGTEKKILESDLQGEISFVTDDFLKNEVDIDNLNRFLQNKIDVDFQNIFSDLDNSFSEVNSTTKAISFQDSSDYIIKTIKKYNYITITPNENSNTTKSKINLHLLIPSIMPIFICAMLWYISGWQLINLITCIIVFILGLGLYLYLISKPNNTPIFFSKIIYKSKEDPFSVLGIFLAIASIFISSSWGIISQYNNVTDSLNDLYKTNYEYHWDDLIEKSDTCSNNIVFIIDNSKSVYQSKVQDFDFKLLNKKINNSGWVESNIRFKCDSTYSDILKAKLKILLYNLNEDKVKGKYSILKFSNGVEKFQTPFENDISENNLRNSFSKIDSINFDGGRTDFDNLLNYIEINYCKEQKDQYQKARYSFIFLTDYIHDKQTEDDEEKIRKSLNRISKYSIFSNFYITKSFEKEKQPKNTILISKIIDGAQNLNCQFINNIMNDNFNVSKITQPRAFVLHYSSYLFSDYIRTSINYDFDNKEKQFDVCIKHKEKEDDRFGFWVKQGSDNSKELFSDEFQTFNLKKKDKLTILMKGYILSQYPNIELIIKDVDNHVDYLFEIVFFKELPKFYRWFIPLFLGIVGFYLILVLAPINRYK